MIEGGRGVFYRSTPNPIELLTTMKLKSICVV